MRKNKHYDAVVVGAGFSGMYMLYLLRKQGLNVHGFERGHDVGGVWYWNRYPGLRCDSESVFFNYTFDEELYKGWTWTSRFPEQPEILRYLNYAATYLDIRKDYTFNTNIQTAYFDEKLQLWNIKTENEEVTAKYFIAAIGTLSASNFPDIPGLERFKGEFYHTGRWPHEPVSFEGKRVAVIGTGSSGIQVIPEIAKESERLYVLQRTPQYSIPARNKPLEQSYIDNIKENFTEWRKKVRFETSGGMIGHVPTKSALAVSEEERLETFEYFWNLGGSGIVGSFTDLATNPEANKTLCDFVIGKIRSIVKDPEVADKLTPYYSIGSKRIVIDTNYYETYNRDNVELISVKEKPIQEITATGILLDNRELQVDMIVFATGYDALTGPLLRMDIRGRNGVLLKDKWEQGTKLRTIVGAATNQFPNMFFVTGPQSPSVLGNVPILIEQHVEWIAQCIQYLEINDIATIEATVEGEESWTEHTNLVASAIFYNEEDSWYNGANIDGKAKTTLIYRGGLQKFRQQCDEISENQYKNFILNKVVKV